MSQASDTCSECGMTFGRHTFDCSTRDFNVVGTNLDRPFPPPKTTAPGLKYDSGKPSLSLIPVSALTATAKVLDYGKQKYDAHNWRKGIEYSRLLDAAMRHLTAFIDRETIDPESNLPHLAHAMCCISFLLEFEAYPECYKHMDDRYDRLKEMAEKSAEKYRK